MINQKIFNGITEDILKQNRIYSISLMSESSVGNRLFIKYAGDEGCEDYTVTIDNELEMIEFAESLKNKKD